MQKPMVFAVTKYVRKHVKIENRSHQKLRFCGAQTLSKFIILTWQKTLFFAHFMFGVYETFSFVTTKK